jgi:hypothetical protein
VRREGTGELCVDSRLCKGDLIEVGREGSGGLDRKSVV